MDEKSSSKDESDATDCSTPAHCVATVDTVGGKAGNTETAAQPHAPEVPRSIARLAFSWLEQAFSAALYQWPWFVVATGYAYFAYALDQGRALADLENTKRGFSVVLLTACVIVAAGAGNAAIAARRLNRRTGDEPPSQSKFDGIAIWLPIVVLSVAYISIADLGSWALVAVLAVFGYALSVQFFLSRLRQETMNTAVLTVISIGLGCLSIYAAVYWLYRVGSTYVDISAASTLLVGLVITAAAIQAVFVLIPSGFGHPGWALVFAALGLLLNRTQDPLTERPNPLLMEQPVEWKPLAGSACSKAVGEAAPSKPMPVPEGNLTARDVWVSAEGGGIRAAYWTAVTLERASQQLWRGQLAQRVRLMSGVSGGSLGIATWAAAQEIPGAARMDCIREFLGTDFLTPLLGGLFFIDIPRLILPTSWVGIHRGDLIEQLIARRWHELTGKTYFYRRTVSEDDWKEAAIQAPLVFNATDALTGRPVHWIAHRAAAGTGNNALTLPSDSLSKGVSRLLAQTRVVQSVHTSARFFYVSPSIDIVAPTDVVRDLVYPDAVAEPIRGQATLASLVDGGYFDNSATYIFQDLLRNSVKNTLILHVVNAQARQCEGTQLSAEAVRTACENWMQYGIYRRTRGHDAWLSRHIEALLAAREWHALDAASAMVRRSGAAREECKPDQSVCVVELGLPSALAKPDKAQRVVPIPQAIGGFLKETTLALHSFSGGLEASSQWLLQLVRSVLGTLVSAPEEVPLGWALAPNARSGMDAAAVEVAREGLSETKD